MSERVPWWVWRTHPAPSKRMTERVEQMVGKRKRVYEQDVELMVEFPYLWPIRAGVRTHWSIRDLAEWAATGLELAVEMNGLTQVFLRWFDKQNWQGPNRSRDIYGGYVRSADGFGVMSAIEISQLHLRGDARRSQRYDFILTPPIYKFCDLTGAFRFDDIGPTTFWIQPQVYEETGEIMQGPPIGEHEDMAPSGRGRGGVGARWALTNHELQKALDGNSWARVDKNESDPVQQRAAAIVRIALDAFLERGTPDPRFVDQGRVAEMARV